MVINGVPALDCSTFADEVKGNELILEPLSKFPVVADLIVDRSVIYENRIRAKAYLESLVLPECLPMEIETLTSIMRMNRK